MARDRAFVLARLAVVLAGNGSATALLDGGRAPATVSERLAGRPSERVVGR